MNTQACLAAAQTSQRLKTEGIEMTENPSIMPKEVQDLSMTDPMVILREKEGI